MKTTNLTFKITSALLVTSVCFLTLEFGLRVLGYPRGDFNAALASEAGLWPPHFDEQINSGPISYRVHANSAGFRGPELRNPDDPADARIVAIGDSMTDGFYVENPDTYPSQLQATLDARGHDVEVINAARGGGSMDRFVEILEDVVLPLEPDVLLVTWVANDIWEFGKFPLQRHALRTRVDRLASAFVRRTAVGEFALSMRLRLRPHYTPRTRSGASIAPQAPDAESVAAFLERFPGTARLLVDAPDADVTERLAIHQRHLARFLEIARAHEIEVAVLTIPSYAEVVSDVPRPYRAGLAAQLEEAGALDVDLLVSLRQGLAERGPLHFAPVDYHLNPTGNAIVAAAAADALTDSGLLGRSRAHID